MLVEHNTVTIAEAEDVFRVVEQFLVSIGYRVESRAEMSLRMTRGRDKAKLKFSPVEWPQSVHVGFDRGRVSMAASLTELNDGRGTVEKMLFAIVVGIEGLLARGQSLDQARADYAAAAGDVDQVFRKDRRRRRIFLGILISLIVLVLTLVIGIAVEGN